jgi:hypothetical protein
LVVVLTVCGEATILFALTALRPALGGGWCATTGTVLLALSIYGRGDLLSSSSAKVADSPTRAARRPTR